MSNNWVKTKKTSQFRTFSSPEYVQLDREIRRTVTGMGVGSAIWGSITGTITDQADLASALSLKENAITSGLTTQYWRGDKTWQALDKASVGLNNVDNTSDVDKPVSNATQTALDLRLTGIASSTDNAIVRFDGTTGKIIQTTSVTIDDVDNIQFPSSSYIGTNASNNFKIITTQSHQNSATNFNVNVDVGNNGTGDFKIYKGAADAAGTLLFTILNDGNVGIGVTTPTSELHVNGTTTSAEFIGGGSGITEIAASNSNIIDASSLITATTVEGALAENRVLINANTITIADHETRIDALESLTSTTVNLTYGRVNAGVNLTAKSFISTGVGTIVDFTATEYSSGMTFSGTNGIIPNVAGRHRASYYLNVGSDETAYNGTILIVQGGISLGSVYINQHNSAGSVNQSSGFIDADVIAGIPIFLQYKPDTTELVAFDKGSYFQLEQLPTDIIITPDSINLDLSSKQNKFSYVSKAIDYAVLNTDFTIDVTVANVTITLPTAVGISGSVFNIKNSSLGQVSVLTSSLQTIDGDTSVIISLPKASITVQSTGSNWIII